jgi:hypothetical protein
VFRNVVRFYSEVFLAPRPTPQLEDHPLPAVRDCLFNTFPGTAHIWKPFLHPRPEDAPCRGTVVQIPTYRGRLERYSAPSQGG